MQTVYRAIAFSVTLLGVTLGHSQAETIPCTPITSVPTVIETPGAYCLTSDIPTAMTFNAAIQIRADHVTLDFQGYALDGSSVGPQTGAIGVAMAYKNNTVRNGTIRGFLYGIALGHDGDGQGNVVEHMRLVQNTFAGFVVGGAGHLLQHNYIWGTGGSTLWTGTAPRGVGMWLLGAPSVRILFNDFSGFVQQAQGAAIAVYAGSAPHALVVGNRITDADYGLLFYGSDTGTAKYRDTLTSEVTTPYTGGIDAGNNH